MSSGVLASDEVKYISVKENLWMSLLFASSSKAFTSWVPKQLQKLKIHVISRVCFLSICQQNSK